MAALNISHELLALKGGDNPVESNEEQERLSASKQSARRSALPTAAA